MDEFKTTDACEKYKCESEVVNILSDTCIMQVQSITNKTNSQVCNSGQNYQIKSLHFITFSAHRSLIMISEDTQCISVKFHTIGIQYKLQGLSSFSLFGPW